MKVKKEIMHEVVYWDIHQSMMNIVTNTMYLKKVNCSSHFKMLNLGIANHWMNPSMITQTYLANKHVFSILQVFIIVQS